MHEHVGPQVARSRAGVVTVRIGALERSDAHVVVHVDSENELFARSIAAKRTFVSFYQTKGA